MILSNFFGVQCYEGFLKGTGQRERILTDSRSEKKNSWACGKKEAMAVDDVRKVAKGRPVHKKNSVVEGAVHVTSGTKATHNSSRKENLCVFSPAGTLRMAFFFSSCMSSVLGALSNHKDTGRTVCLPLRPSARLLTCVFASVEDRRHRPRNIYGGRPQSRWTSIVGMEYGHDNSRESAAWTAPGLVQGKSLFGPNVAALFALFPAR